MPLPGEARADALRQGEPRALIALDARCTSQMSVGMIRYAKELRARLPVAAPDLDFFAFEHGENFGYAEQIELPLTLWKKRPKIVHHLALYAPVIGLHPAIVTIHDLIHLEFPEYFKKHVGPYYQLVVRALAKRAARVITDDERTIDELERRLGVDPKKIRVIPLGVDPQYLDPRFDADPARPDGERPYLIYAGNHREHKNLTTLISAWNALDDSVPYDLVLTGPDDFPAEMPRARPNGARIFFLGNVEEAKLLQLLYAADALVYPSLSEGFGLPMLEALAIGTAVIASDRAVPGVLRHACTVVPARNIDAWREAISQLRITGAQGRRARRAHSGQFTWDRCAALTADCYREVLEEQKSRAR